MPFDLWSVIAIRYALIVIFASLMLGCSREMTMASSISLEEYAVIEALARHVNRDRLEPLILSDSTYPGVCMEDVDQSAANPCHFYYHTMYRDSMGVLSTNWIDQNAGKPSSQLKQHKRLDSSVVQVAEIKTLPEDFYRYDHWRYLMVTRVGFNTAGDSALIGFNVEHPWNYTPMIRIALMRREESGWVYDSAYDSLFWAPIR